MTDLDYLSISDFPVYCPVCGEYMGESDKAKFILDEGFSWVCAGCETEWTIQALLTVLNEEEE